MRIAIENDLIFLGTFKMAKPPITSGFNLSERKDLNLRPLLPQSSALPSCATPRQIYKYSTSGSHCRRRHKAKLGGFAWVWEAFLSDSLRTI